MAELSFLSESVDSLRRDERCLRQQNLHQSGLTSNSPGERIRVPLRLNSLLAAEKIVGRFGLRTVTCLKNEIQIAELVPEIFSGDGFLVGYANLFWRQKCA